MKSNRGILIQLLTFIVILVVIGFTLNRNSIVNPGVTKTYSESELIDVLNEEEVESINVDSNDGVYTVSGEYEGQNDDGEDATIRFTSNLPTTGDSFNNVISAATENDVSVITNKIADTSMVGFIFQIIFYVVLFGLMGFFLTRMMGKNGPGGIAGNKAKLSTKTNVKFKDVIGYEEEKHELVEVIDFLKNPKSYDDIGAKVPNGILLEGPPGTGKTLIAKAVAGEVDIPFYFISGSDFIEMYVGVGASRVRSLFKEAKKQERAIIFIDEIDAIGSRQSSSMGGRNTEQQQTINQLLVELDGFATSKGGIIIIAATNRADKLDPALLRSGRFDRKIVVNLPELKEREMILEYHSRNRKHGDIDFKELAKMTTGMSGAQLEAVTNEAAILAVRNNRNEFDNEDIKEAIDRVLMGPAKYSNKYTERDKNIVAYHESGHAISGLNVKYSNKVQKITIIPRRNAGGYVSYTPEEDNQKTMSKKQLEAQLVSLLAGRAAEEIFIGSISQGAHNDFERATNIARAMVTRFGMTELGLYQFENQRYLEGYEQRAFSDKTNELIDQKVDEILRVHYEKAKKVLTEHTDDMHLLADAIKKYETLDRTDIDYLMEHRTLEKEETADANLEKAYE